MGRSYGSSPSWGVFGGAAARALRGPRTQQRQNGVQANRVEGMAPLAFGRDQDVKVGGNSSCAGAKPFPDPEQPSDCRTQGRDCTAAAQHLAHPPTRPG